MLAVSPTSCTASERIATLPVSNPPASSKTEKAKFKRNAIKILGGKIEEVVRFQLPDTEIGRSFVKIKKHKNTAKKYPRKAGLPSKEPLV